MHTDAAAILQHEYDHLNGVLYVDKMDPTTLTHNSVNASYVGVRGGTWEWLD